MNPDSPQRTIGDYFGLQRGTTYKSRLLGFPGPVLLGLSTIQRNGGFRRDSLRTYGGDSPTRLLVKPGDLYVSLKDVTQAGDLLGAVARLPLDQEAGRLTQDTVRLEPLSDDLPLDYLYWLLRTPHYRDYCRAHATGTTNLGLPRDDFLAFPVPEPTQERIRIADLLTAIDARIDLNGRMNETVEEMARALFKSWFVDSTECETRSLVRLDEILTLHYGKGLRKNERQPGVVPVYGSGGVFDFHNNPLVQGPTIVVGRKGSVGSLFWVDGPSHPGDTVFYVESRLPLTYCFYLLETLGLRDMNTDAAVPGLNRDNVYRLEVATPPDSIVQRFDVIVSTFRERIRVAGAESRTLAALRDTLLPKLISGELRVPDAERLVSGVI